MSGEAQEELSAAFSSDEVPMTTMTDVTAARRRTTKQMSEYVMPMMMLVNTQRM